MPEAPEVHTIRVVVIRLTLSTVDDNTQVILPFSYYCTCSYFSGAWTNPRGRSSKMDPDSDTEVIYERPPMKNNVIHHEAPAVHSSMYTRIPLNPVSNPVSPLHQ